MRLLSRSFSTVSRSVVYPHIYHHPHSSTHTKISLWPIQSSRYLGISQISNPFSPSNFSANPGFLPFVYQIYSLHAHLDANLRALATYRKEGWLNIGDERNPAFWGRTPEIEDLLGCVLVRDGRIVEGSFREGGMFRIITTKGPVKFNEWIAKRLEEAARNEFE